jgi:hypothetical protein
MVRCACAPQGQRTSRHLVQRFSDKVSSKIKEQDERTYHGSNETLTERDLGL